MVVASGPVFENSRPALPDESAVIGWRRQALVDRSAPDSVPRGGLAAAIDSYGCQIDRNVHRVAPPGSTVRRAVA